MNDLHHFQQNSTSRLSRSVWQSIPTSITTYARLHLDTLSKVINHVLSLLLVCNVFLFINSFSMAYLPQHLGFHTVFGSFVLLKINILISLVINNSRISSLSILAPTEHMVGMATGASIMSSILAGMLSSTYHVVTYCNSTTDDGNDRTSNNNSTATTSYDPLLKETCANHRSSMTGIWFWAGLIAWLQGLLTMLLFIGRHELSRHYSGGASGSNHHQYESIPTTTSTTPTTDFEEEFRRQQEAILGQQQAAHLQQLSATTTSFVGDYASVPEVTTHSQPPQTITTTTTTNNTSSAPQPQQQQQ